MKTVNLREFALIFHKEKQRKSHISLKLLSVDPAPNSCGLALSKADLSGWEFHRSLYRKQVDRVESGEDLKEAIPGYASKAKNKDIKTIFEDFNRIIVANDIHGVIIGKNNPNKYPESAKMSEELANSMPPNVILTQQGHILAFYIFEISSFLDKLKSGEEISEMEWAKVREDPYVNLTPQEEKLNLSTRNKYVKSMRIADTLAAALLINPWNGFCDHWKKS
ncbi:hypothetical protein LWI29_038175 [Acer saccharum]|uniref:Uncharacterized protein n=1 Tax=Acer saccharum TaxID=4024 RepID=A0AA39TJ08_ACESA|nr:hypothetical protein LWI29_038175 [Acer saccharum]